MTDNAGRRRFGPGSIWPDASSYWEKAEKKEEPAAPITETTAKKSEPAEKPSREKKPNQQEQPEEAPQQGTENEAEEDDDDDEIDEIDLKGFQVVRREFFAHTRVPAIAFSDGKVSVNTACVRIMPEVEYVQILIKRETRQLAINPCEEKDLYAFQWSKTKDGKRFPKQITGRLFFLKLCDLMGWNPEHRYKILGRIHSSNGRLLFVFDLASCETYERSPKDNDGKRKTSRVPIFPLEWKDQFGIPFEEQHKALQVNMFEGFTLFSLKEAKKTKHKDTDEEVQE